MKYRAYRHLFDTSTLTHKCMAILRSLEIKVPLVSEFQTMYIYNLNSFVRISGSVYDRAHNLINIFLFLFLKIAFITENSIFRHHYYDLNFSYSSILKKTLTVILF